MKFDPHRLAAQLEASAALLRRHGTAAQRLAHDWASPLRSSGGRSGKGGHSDPTGTAATDPHDPTRAYAATLDLEATAVSTHLALLMTPVVELGRASKSYTPKAARTPSAGAGECSACRCWVSGAANDRLRAGYCDACRKAWDRAGRPDRATFARSRAIEPDDGTDIWERLNPGHVGDTGDAA